MRPNANIIKTYWQAMDANEEVFMYNAKPDCKGGEYICSDKCTPTFLFPIPLKPLQIAEIKVCENGTWSYEIEREEGYYMAKGRSGAEYILRHKNGQFFHYGGGAIEDGLYTISSTRIPDECII